MATKSYYISHRTSLEYPVAYRSAGVVYLPINITECEVKSFDDNGTEIIKSGYSFDEYRISSPENLPEPAVMALLERITSVGGCLNDS